MIYTPNPFKYPYHIFILIHKYITIKHFPMSQSLRIESVSRFSYIPSEIALFPRLPVDPIFTVSFPIAEICVYLYAYLYGEWEKILKKNERCFGHCGERRFFFFFENVKLSKTFTNLMTFICY